MEYAVVRPIIPSVSPNKAPPSGSTIEARMAALEAQLATLERLMLLNVLSHKDVPITSVPVVFTGNKLGVVQDDYKLLWKNTTGRLVNVRIFGDLLTNGLRVKLSKDASAMNQLDELSNSGALGAEPGKIFSEPILLGPNKSLYIALADVAFPGVLADKFHVRVFDPGAEI